MLANLLANCGNSCNTHKGYEHLESERDDVNGLPELWDIDRLAGYLSVSKHFAYPPLLPRCSSPGNPGRSPTGVLAGRGRSATVRIVRHSRRGRRDKAEQREQRGEVPPTQLGAGFSAAGGRNGWQPDTSSVPLAPGTNRSGPSRPNRCSGSETGKAGLRRSDIAR
jgi:hypothetical protein